MKIKISNPDWKPSTKAKEKKLEPELTRRVKRAGGLALKFPAIHFAGIPDRIVLLPGARCMFCEMKSQGKKPSAVQRVVHDQLRKLGFKVYVISNHDELNNFTNTYLSPPPA